MKPKLPHNYLLVLAAFTAFNIAALFVRNQFEQNNTYNFLLWNLFLAFVPLAAAWATHFIAGKGSKLILYACTIFWLLFYPNAPYMISDLIHVNAGSSVVLYDTLIIFSFSTLALFYGFYSMKIIQLVYQHKWGKKTALVMVLFSIVLSSAGIYLGRILRLNSWDLFTHPLQTMQTIWQHLFPVSKNPTTYVLVLLFSIIQFAILLLMKDLDSMKEIRNKNKEAKEDNKTFVQEIHASLAGKMPEN